MSSTSALPPERRARRPARLWPSRANLKLAQPAPAADPIARALPARPAWGWLVMRDAGRAELVMVLGLVLIAVAARLPYLWSIPRFTDETSEAMIGLQIARGEAFPLTNVDPYIGSLWNYVLAAGFLVGGPSLYTPRLLIALLGALTVVPTYLLGRSLGERRVLTGALAGLLLALSPTHIVVDSHLAWSNCLTPLFAVCGLWLAHRAVVGNRPRLLILSGFSFGLGLQTHPVGVLLLPGVAVAVAMMRPRWLRGPWPWLAVVAAALGSLNLLLANVMSNFDGLTVGAAVQSGYTKGEVLTLGVYADRLHLTLRLLSDSLGAVLAESGVLSGPLSEPMGLLFLVLAAIGLEMLARRRDGLLVAAILSYVLLLPVVSGRYEALVPKARYIAPLLPICYALAALALTEALDWIGRPAARRALPACLTPPLLRAALGIVALVALLGPLVSLAGYYDAALRDGRTNDLLFWAIDGIEASRRDGDQVYAERGTLIPYTLGGGKWGDHLAFAAMVYGWKRLTLQPPSPDAQIVPRVVGPLLVRTSQLPLMARLYRLEPVASGPPDGAPVRVVYSRGAQPGLLTAGRQEQRDDVPQPPRPPRVEPFVDGVHFPSSLQFAPDGRLFFGEVSEGRVRIASSGGELQPEPFLELPAAARQVHGALSLALDPGFAENHRVYVFFSEADGEGRPVRYRLVRYTERDGLAAEPTVLAGDLPIEQARDGVGERLGGRIAFGPDRKLYVAVGEPALSGVAGDGATSFGTVLRLNPDGSIPPDNPSGDSPVYALGLRDIFGLAFRASSGQLYATGVGPDGVEELRLMRSSVDAASPLVASGAGVAADFDGAMWYSPDEQLGIAGLTVYTGSLFPEYAGDLFFCSFDTGTLRRVRVGGPALDQVDWVESIARDCRLDVTNGPDGTLYFSDLARIFRLTR